MELLKKHYEKIVLLVLLVVFALLLLYLLDIIRSTGDVTEDDLKIPTPKANYEVANPDSRQFDFGKLLNTMERKMPDGKITELPLEWRGTPPRDVVNKEFSTDLTYMYKAAKCAFCGRLVPSFYFSGKDCPLCGKKLLAPKNPTRVKDHQPGEVDVTLDTDKDGIPDVVEKEMGLDMKVASDAMEDMDNDGFPNLYEYLAKTDMKNPKSHPALDLGLRLDGFQRTKLPVLLKNVYSDGSLCQLDMATEVGVGNEKDVRIRSQFLGKGDKVKLEDDKEYVVDAIFPKFEVDAATQIRKNISEVRFVCGKDVIIMKIDGDVYAPHEKAIFEYLFDDKSRVCGVGEKFSLGDSRVGVVKYTVKALDGAGHKVVITSKGQDIVIGKEYRIPEKFRPSGAAKRETPSVPRPSGRGASSLPLPGSL